MQNHGGASLTISNADGRGGGGGVHVQGASATVVRSSFTSNVGGGGHRFGGGGGAAVFMGTLTLDHCQLTLNEGGPEGTVAGGGAITCESGTLTITACAVHANLGGLYGGTNPTSPRVSGGILSFSTMLLMENCVLAANVSTAATLNVPGGLTSSPARRRSGHARSRVIRVSERLAPGSSRPGAGVLVANTIVWGNVPAGLLATGTATASVSYSCLQAPISGTGNIVTDPLFVSASTGDLSLTSASPCIDAGDPALAAPDLDLNGLFRRIDGNLDAVMRANMGAIEFTNVRLTGPTVVTPGTLLTWTVNGPPGGVGGVWFSLARGFKIFPPFGHCSSILISRSSSSARGLCRSRSATSPPSPSYLGRSTCRATESILPSSWATFRTFWS